MSLGSFINKKWQDDKAWFLIFPLLLFWPTMFILLHITKDPYPCQDESFRCRVQRADAAGCEIPSDVVRAGELVNEGEIESAVGACGY
jgi:hypothetical protein